VQVCGRQLLAFAIVGLVTAGGAQAGSYPDHPLRLVVGYGAGGGTDLVARAIQPDLSRALGVSVIVENRPGGGGAVGAGFVARSAPDGYTVLLSSASGVTITPLLNPGVQYRRTSFTPVAQITIAPLVIAVNKDLGVHSIPELIAAAKAAPGKLNFASSGIGSGPHLAGVLFDEVAGVTMTHIPFRSGAAATLSVLSGDTQVTFATTPSVMPQVNGGELVGLAVSTRQPSPLVPELPGSEKAGLPAYEIFQWNGLFVPTGTPPDTVAKLYQAVKTAMAQPDIRRILAVEGTDIAVSPSPDAFLAFLKSDDVFWEKLVRDSGITSTP
jgi:tripartite-type tricarboxylate transporter receptor subunit TctC